MIPLIIAWVIFSIFGAAGAMVLIGAIVGKKLVIIGATGVGKTTLHNYFREGIITKEYIVTHFDKVRGRKFQLRDLKLKIAEGYDVSGGDAFLPKWRELVNNGDIIIYVVDAHRLNSNDSDYIKTLDKQLLHVFKWIEEYKKNDNFFIVGTKSDIDGIHPRDGQHEMIQYQHNIIGLLKPHFGGFPLSAVRVLVGTLIDQVGCEDIAGRFLKLYLDKNK
jgi:GTPase SAR1 family protein